jgi:hypothetical protein
MERKKIRRFVKTITRSLQSYSIGVCKSHTGENHFKPVSESSSFPFTNQIFISSLVQKNKLS